MRTSYTENTRAALKHSTYWQSDAWDWTWSVN